MRAFAGGVVGGALALGIGAVTTELAGTVKGIAAIGDEARRSGLGVEAFQELKFVAEQSRIPVDALIDGIKELNLRADEFVVTGKGSAAEAFARLGYGATDLKKRLEDPKELMIDIIGRMEALDDAAQIRVADEIFGGTGGERFVELLAQGDEGVRALIARAHDLGAVLDAEAIEKADALDKKFGEIQAKVSNLAKRGVVALADAIEDALTIDVDEIFGSAERAIAMMGQGAYDEMKKTRDLTDDQVRSATDLKDVYDALARSINAATQPGSGIRLMDVADLEVAHDLAAILQDLEGEMQAFNAGEKEADAFGDAVDDLVTEAEDLIKELDKVDAARFQNVIAAIGGIAGALAAARQQAVDLVKALPGSYVSSGRGDGYSEAAKRRAESGIQETGVFYTPQSLSVNPNVRPKMAPPMTHELGGGAGGGRSKGGGGRNRDDWASEIQSTREEIAKLEAEAMSMVVAAGYGKELGDALEFARKRAELLHAAQQAGKAITPELTEEVDALAMAYAEAGMKAEEAEDRLTALQENAKRGADAIGDIFTSVLDGTRSAKDAVLDLLREILRVRMISNLNRYATGSAGGFFQILGGLLTPRAAGGPVTAGQPYMVGERGPEPFIPAENGRILSVPQAQAALRGGSGTVNVQVTGGDLTLQDDGSIAAKIRVSAVAAAQSGQRAAVEEVKMSLPSWSVRMSQDGVV
ncbi:hypothetical protein [Oceanicola sp. 22II-s10i]|uniref:hypothetical protein n=1 Tax=Oceanicola sp. 22II-s10i TaxID=1317116 RepID=UPI0020CEC2EB|nr:hypothetical protein [Oceanicola sp. 22II-s10i]